MASRQNLNYPIKYVDVGKTQAIPFYLVNGEWITRGKVPEVKERKKKWRSDPVNRARENKRMRDRYWEDPKKENLRTRTWKKNNIEKVKTQDKRYRQKERGYFNELWNGVRKSKHGHTFKNFNDFYQCWLDQKAISGMICPATGVEMTMIKRTSSKGGKKRTMTNISRDRILCSRGYSKQNLIFTTWDYNNSKHNISPKGAKAFLRIVRERYGTDEVE